METPASSTNAAQNTDAIIEIPDAEQTSSESNTAPETDVINSKKLALMDDKKKFTVLSWASIVLSTLPVILFVFLSNEWNIIKKFDPLQSIYFPMVMLAITYMGSYLSRQINNRITNILNGLSGTFHIFLLILYFTTEVVGGVHGVMLMPLMLPFILPLVFFWIIGERITLRRFRKGTPPDTTEVKDLDPLKATLPDKQFAELIFQILGVFLVILLAYSITEGILALSGG